MQNLFKSIDISRFKVKEKADDPTYRDCVNWYAQLQFPHIPKKNRYYVAFKKIEAVPPQELIAWKLTAEKDSQPLFKFNTAFKAWRLHEERAAQDD